VSAEITLTAGSIAAKVCLFDAALKFDNGGLHPFLCQRIEPVPEKTAVLQNLLLELIALFAHGAHRSTLIRPIIAEGGRGNLACTVADIAVNIDQLGKV
jgi:hypothetical protein